MSKTNRKRNQYRGRQRRISVRAIRRESPDLRRLGRAIVSLALLEAEAEAAAQREAEAERERERTNRPPMTRPPMTRTASLTGGNSAGNGRSIQRAPWRCCGTSRPTSVHRNWYSKRAARPMASAICSAVRRRLCSKPATHRAAASRYNGSPDQADDSRRTCGSQFAGLDPAPLSCGSMSPWSQCARWLPLWRKSGATNSSSSKLSLARGGFHWPLPPIVRRRSLLRGGMSPGMAMARPLTAKSAQPCGPRSATTASHVPFGLVSSLVPPSAAPRCCSDCWPLSVPASRPVCGSGWRRSDQPACSWRPRRGAGHCALTFRNCSACSAGRSAVMICPVTGRPSETAAAGTWHNRSLRVVADSVLPGSKPLALDARGALHHLHVIGPTGTGKSTLLGNLIGQDIQDGRAVVVIEPKGDLVADVLARVPAHRVPDIVLLDPMSAYDLTCRLVYDLTCRSRRIDHCRFHLLRRG